MNDKRAPSSSSNSSSEGEHDRTSTHPAQKTAAQDGQVLEQEPKSRDPSSIDQPEASLAEQYEAQLERLQQRYNAVLA